MQNPYSNAVILLTWRKPEKEAGWTVCAKTFVSEWFVKGQNRKNQNGKTVTQLLCSSTRNGDIVGKTDIVATDKQGLWRPAKNSKHPLKKLSMLSNDYNPNLGRPRQKDSWGVSLLASWSCQIGEFQV